MLQVIILQGLPASGKSFFTKELINKNPNKYKRWNNDLFREMVDNSNWSKDSEKFVMEMRDIFILEALENGKHVIVDNTNLHPKHETNIRNLVKGKAEVVIEDFTHVPLEVCIERDLKRLNSVGEKVIREMYNQFLKPKPEIVKYNIELSHCIIVDIDGTVAKMENRSPYDWDKVDTDTYIKNVCYAVGGYADSDHNIIFLSGRDEICREKTEKWLDAVPYSGFKNRTALYMRPHNDYRKDSIIKEELYRKYIEGKYNVEAVFDDRLSVCRLWHQLGLPLFRVGDPDSNF